jgi:hypothetical protein
MPSQSAADAKQVLEGLTTLMAQSGMSHPPTSTQRNEFRHGMSGQPKIMQAKWDQYKHFGHMLENEQLETEERLMRKYSPGHVISCLKAHDVLKDVAPDAAKPDEKISEAARLFEQLTNALLGGKTSLHSTEKPLGDKEFIYGVWWDVFEEGLQHLDTDESYNTGLREFMTEEFPLKFSSALMAAKNLQKVEKKVDRRCEDLLNSTDRKLKNATEKQDAAVNKRLRGAEDKINNVSKKLKQGGGDGVTVIKGKDDADKVIYCRKYARGECTAEGAAGCEGAHKWPNLFTARFVANKLAKVKPAKTDAELQAMMDSQ